MKRGRVPFFARVPRSVWFTLALTPILLSMLFVRSAWPDTRCAQLARKADVAVIGTVTKISPRQLPELGGIFSFITLDVERSIKGSVSAPVTIREFGGRVGNLVSAEVAEGDTPAPTWTEGERVLVFLWYRSKDHVYSLYSNDSKLVLQRDANGHDIVSQGGENLSDCLAAIR